MALFAVKVDNPAGTAVIHNSVVIGSAEGPGGGGTANTVVGATLVPALTAWGLAAAIVLLTAVAWLAGRRTRNP